MGLNSLPAIYLGPYYGGGDEDDGDLLQKVACMHCYTQCPWPCSRPPVPHASAGDSWTLMGKSGSVSCAVTAPFCWIPVCTRLCLRPPRVYFPVLYKFWELYGGVNGDLLQEGLCHAQVCCTQLQQATADPHLHRTCSHTVLSQSLWGSWVLVRAAFVWALWASLAGTGFDSKCEFAPLTILLLGRGVSPWLL